MIKAKLKWNHRTQRCKKKKKVAEEQRRDVALVVFFFSQGFPNVFLVVRAASGHSAARGKIILRHPEGLYLFITIYYN